MTTSMKNAIFEKKNSSQGLSIQKKNQCVSSKPQCHSNTFYWTQEKNTFQNHLIHVHDNRSM